jgi:hypothetical protein
MVSCPSSLHKQEFSTPYMVSLSFGGTILFFISLYYRERIHSKQLTLIDYINNTSIHTSDLELQDFAASTCTDSTVIAAKY